MLQSTVWEVGCYQEASLLTVIKFKTPRLKTFIIRSLLQWGAGDESGRLNVTGFNNYYLRNHLVN